MLMKMLERFEKRKYDKQEHVLASTSSKKARACVRDIPLSLSPFCTSENYKIEKRILKRKHFEILKQKHPKHFCNKGIEMVIACYPKCYKQHKYPTGRF